MAQTPTELLLDAAFETAIERDRLREINAELLAALKDAVAVGIVPKSSASEGGANKHSEQVHVADQIRAAIAKAEAP